MTRTATPKTTAYTNRDPKYRHKPTDKETYKNRLAAARTLGAKIRLLRKPEDRAEPGSSKHLQYKQYRDRETVEAFMKRVGRRDWLRRDLEYGHISIEA